MMSCQVTNDSSATTDLPAACERSAGMDRRRFVLVAATALVAGPRALAAVQGGGTALALVTADLEGHVAVYDLERRRVVRRIATLDGPRSIEASLGRAAVVAHSAGGAVTLLDGLAVRRVLRGFAEPRYAAASPDGRAVYVTDSGTGELVTLDLRRGRVAHRLGVGGPARHLALSPDGRRLWVILGNKAARVAVLALDGERPRLLRTFAPPFLAHDAGFANGGTVWLTSGDSRLIALVRGGSRPQLRVIRADAPPQHVTFVLGRAHVTSGDDGLLRTHRAHDGELLATARVPTGSHNVQAAAGRTLSPSLSQGTLVVATPSGTVVDEARIASSSHDAAFVMAR